MPMRRDFLKLCGLAGLGLACPGGARPPLAPRRTKKDDAVRRPVLRRLQRLRRLGHHLPHGPQGRQRDQPPLQGRRHPDARGAQVRPDREARQGRDEQRGLLRRVRRRTADLQRPRLLGQQPLARRPLHGHRQARQPGLPDVRRAGRRLPRAGLPARVPDLRQLLGHRQPRGHVARAVPAVAPEDRQRRRHRGQRAVALPRQVRARPHRAGAARGARGAAPRSRGCRGPSAARTCSTRPR